MADLLPWYSWPLLFDLHAWRWRHFECLCLMLGNEELPICTQPSGVLVGGGTAGARNRKLRRIQPPVGSSLCGSREQGFSARSFAECGGMWGAGHWRMDVLLPPLPPLPALLETGRWR